VSATRYFHGGPAGIPLLDWIQPPSVTGRVSSQEVGPDDLRARARAVHRQDRVYVTTERAAAALFASGHRNGSVYEVEPAGDLEPDPDCSLAGLSFACLRARVVRVFPMSERDMQRCRFAMFATDAAARLAQLESSEGSEKT